MWRCWIYCCSIYRTTNAISLIFRIPKTCCLNENQCVSWHHFLARLYVSEYVCSEYKWECREIEVVFIYSLSSLLPHSNHSCFIKIVYCWGDQKSWGRSHACTLPIFDLSILFSFLVTYSVFLRCYFPYRLPFSRQVILFVYSTLVINIEAVFCCFYFKLYLLAFVFRLFNFLL